jgi:hypothetical protein
MTTIPESHWDYENRRPKLDSQWQTAGGHGLRGWIRTYGAGGTVGVDTVDGNRANRQDLYFYSDPPGIPAWEPVIAEPVTYTQQQLDAAIVHARGAVLADVQRANEILNERATDASLCDSYESALDDVNRAVSTFQLHGRKKTYNVSFNVTVGKDFGWSAFERIIDGALADEGDEACDSFYYEESDS